MSPAPPRRRPASFPRPFASLAIVYIFGFFFVYALAMVVPALIEVMNTVPPGPELERAAENAAYEAAQGRMGLAFLLSLATVVLGVWTQKLPGLKR
jgi:hypothetical protein